MRLGIKRSLCVAGCLSVLILPAANASGINYSVSLKGGGYSKILNKGVITGAAIIIGDNTYTEDFVNNASIDLSEQSSSKLWVENDGLTLTNDGSIINISGFLNNGTITTTTNNGTLSIVGGTNGNHGTLTQNVINITAGNFNNDSDITAHTSLTNSGADFTNSGNIISASITNTTKFTNTGTIGSALNKANITNSGTFNVEGGTLNVNTITNEAGTFTNKVASTIDKIDNKNGATYNNDANTTVTTVTNGGTFNNNAELNATTVTNTNNFTNTSNVTAGTLTNEKTFINTDGTVTVNASFENKSTGTISGGELNLKNGGTNSGTISGATVNVENGTLTNGGSITGSTTTVKTGAALTNNGSITNGSTTVNSGSTFTNNGSITNSSTTVNGGATFTNNANKTISGGSIIANGTLENDGKISGSSIKINGANSVNSGTGTIENSTTDINVDFTNNGTITGGTTNIKDTVTLTNKGTMNGTGTVTVSGTLDNKGTVGGALALNINKGASVNVDGTNASISTSGKITVAQDASLNIKNGGSATLKAGDDWSGSITNTNGTLNLSGRTDTGKDYTQSGGTLNLTNSTFELAAGSSITAGIVNVTGGSFSLADGANMTGGSVNVTSGTVDVAGKIADGAELSITNGVTYDIKPTGDVVLNNNDTWNGTGTVQLSGGTLDFQGAKDGVNGVLKADSGNLKINSELTLGNNSSIASLVNTEINKDVTIGSGATVSLNTGDTWNADVTVSGGTLNYSDLTSNGALHANSGNVNVTGGELTIASGSAIDGLVNTQITGGKVIVGGGSVTLNGNDKWTGDIDLTSGSLDVNLANTNTGKLTASGGNLNVNGGTLSLVDGSSVDTNVTTVLTGNVDVKTGSELNLNQGDIWNTSSTVSLNGGTLNYNDISNDGKIVANSGKLNINSGTLNVGSGSSIISAVNTHITGDMNISGNGSVLLDGSDTWAGDITMSGGSLDYSLGSNGNLKATGGNLNVSGGKLTLENNNLVGAGVKTTLTGDVDVKSGSELNLNSGDTWNASSTVSLNGGILNYSDISNSGKIDANSGTLNIKSGTLNVGTDSSIISEVNTHVTGNMNISGNGSVVLDGEDTWSGDITMSGGSLDYSLDSNGKLIATGGELTVSGGKLTIASDSKIESAVNAVITGNMDITGGSVVLDGNDTWSGDVTMTGGSLDYSLDSNGKLVATGGSLNVSGGTLTLNTDSSVGADVTTVVDSDVHVNGGSLNLNTGDSWTSGVITLDNGTFNYSNITSTGKLVAADGIFNLNSGNLTLVDSSSIAAEVDTTVAGTLNLNNASVVLDDKEKDSWTGVVNLNGGSLDYALESNGALHAEKGNLTVSAGKLTLVGGSYVKYDVVTVINKDVDIKGGELNLNIGDSWASDSIVTLNGGTLNYSDLTANGIFHGEKGSLNTKAGSVFNVTGNADTPAYIKSDVAANIGGDLVIGTNGVVDLGKKNQNDAQDSVLGDVTVNSGGTLNIFNDLNFKPVNEGEYSDQLITINDGAKMNLNTTGELHLNPNLTGKGLVDKNGEGDVWFHGTITDDLKITIKNGGDLLFEQGLGGNLIVGEEVDGKGLTIGIHADEIKGNLIQERDITMKYSTYHDDIDLNLASESGSIVNVTKGAIIAESKGNNNINIGGTVTINPEENWEKPVSMTAVSNGSINFNNNVNVTSSTLNLSSGKSSNFNANTVLKGSDLNVISGDLNFDKLTFIGTDAVVHDMNGQINNNTIADLDIYDGKADFTVDLNGRDWQHDKFVISDITDMDGGNIHISDWQFADDWNRTNKAPIDRHIIMNMFDVSKVDPSVAANINFTQTDKEIFTPIGWYKLENYTQWNKQLGAYESVPGVIQSSLVRYNPQVFRGQVATLAMHNNQLLIDDMLTNHVGLHSERFLDPTANKYAIHEGNYVGPYQYTKEDGGIWMKNFVSFEKLSMTQNLRVGNNFYGTLIGADMPVVDLKRGWKLVPTAYIGYNGAHQYFSNVSMYQNGGQLGFMGTFLKENFVGSVLAYAGAYLNDMKVNSINEYTENFFVGTAAKAAYNYHPTKHFTIQPNVFVSYNFFGKQNWHSNFGDMCMNSGYMNGVNVAPGLNLIYARETWSAYATFQYMYNINDDLTGRAGNVMLDGVQMRHGYIQYGIGMTKTWKERMNSYFQVVLRNGGRTGIGFQLGAQYLFDWKTPWSKKTQPAPKHEIKL